VISSKDDFSEYVQSIQSQSGYKAPLAFGLGVRRFKGDKTLDVCFPLINYKNSLGTAAVFHDCFDLDYGVSGYRALTQKSLKIAYEKFTPFHDNIKDHPNVSVLKTLLEATVSEPFYGSREVIVYTLYDKDQPVVDAVEGYFKLQCLSQRHVKPHGLSLEGVFGKLNNVAWTNKGPILVEDFQEEQTRALLSEPLRVSHVDKFPYMVDYCIPGGIRVVSGAQVRLGAHLGEGTTVMPAGYVNFNAGTLGNAMIEGRVSAGVVVDKDTDIGGGASIMGTLSGGNNHVISIGSKCLMGANAGTGISLGDGCTIAAGAYVTAAAKISYYNADGQPINLAGEGVDEGANIFKGADFSGKTNLLFLQDSVSGKVTARPNPKMIQLNDELHKN